mmetsp:Transcript_25928/g.88742  ORF Transcript_25928/g.88742 Transcript_25928/m.88742 type:complete len:247 (-) Transcript_25928:71-811(-)
MRSLRRRSSSSDSGAVPLPVARIRQSHPHLRKGFMRSSSPIVDGTVGLPAATHSCAHSSLDSTSLLPGSWLSANCRFLTVYSWPQNTRAPAGREANRPTSVSYIDCGSPSNMRPHPATNSASPVNTAGAAAPAAAASAHTYETCPVVWNGVRRAVIVTPPRAISSPSRTARVHASTPSSSPPTTSTPGTSSLSLALPPAWSQCLCVVSDSRGGASPSRWHAASTFSGSAGSTHAHAPEPSSTRRYA